MSLDLPISELLTNPKFLTMKSTLLSSGLAHTAAIMFCFCTHIYRVVACSFSTSCISFSEDQMEGIEWINVQHLPRIAHLVRNSSSAAADLLRMLGRDESVATIALRKEKSVSASRQVSELLISRPRFPDQFQIRDKKCSRTKTFPPLFLSLTCSASSRLREKALVQCRLNSDITHTENSHTHGAGSTNVYKQCTPLSILLKSISCERIFNSNDESRPRLKGI